MPTPDEIAAAKAAQEAKAAEAKAAQDAKEAEAKAAKEAEEKADLAALTEWVAKAMVMAHQVDHPMPIDSVDPTPALTAAREFVAASKALASYRPKREPKSEPAKDVPKPGVTGTENGQIGGMLPSPSPAAPGPSLPGNPAAINRPPAAPPTSGTVTSASVQK